ncbi:MAG TPA: phosphoglycerate dehydrogenase [Desulfotomaculum sp.]|nr:phosphoglycerate dehydrogenase [Desulfotomaculum sp.]
MDNVAEEGLTPLRKEENIEVVLGKPMDEAALVSTIGGFDALIVRSATRVTESVLKAGNRLKVVGRAGVGVDNIDVEAATRRGILVVNAPDGNTIAATEHTIAMMLALARNIPQAAAKMREGIWDKKSFTGIELRGKVLGIIGLGRIGMAVAKRAQALEMEVIACDPYMSAEKAGDLSVELLSIEELFKKADFITVHAPKTKDTCYLINDQAFSLMKDGVRIVNCARGGVIDEDALHRAMISGKVAGAALDVFEVEPCTDNPLFKLPNFIATPHLGASTREAQINVALDVSKEIVDVINGRLAKNAVNIPSISIQTLNIIGPFLSLAEKMGGFLAQLLRGRINKLEVIYSGELFSVDVSPITTAVIKGLLDPVLNESVNFVNAPLLARNRGLKVLQSVNGEAMGYANLITLKVSTDLEEKCVAGTLLGKDDAHLVMIDGYRVDTIPSGHLLYVPHYDKPRIIGPVGILIGEHNINIASMQVGRKDRGGPAIMMLSVDAPVPEKTLKEISLIEGVLDVRMVSL